MQKYRNRFERMTVPRQKTEIRKPIADLKQTAPTMAAVGLAAMERKRKYVIRVAGSVMMLYVIVQIRKYDLSHRIGKVNIDN